MVQSPIFVVCPILETKHLRKRKSLTVPILQGLLRCLLGIGDVFEGIDLETVFPRVRLMARTFAPVRKAFAARFQTRARPRLRSTNLLIPVRLEDG